MSDLQDAIARTSVKAFNSGYLTGAWDERVRIIEIIENRICFDHKNGCDHAACYALADLIDAIPGGKK